MTFASRRCLPLLISLLPCSQFYGEPVMLDGAELAIRAQQAYEKQSRELCGYSVERTYTLTNKHLNPSARMTVKLTDTADQPKKFQVLSINATGIARRSLLDLLRQESAGEGFQNDKSSLAPRNYNFTVLDKEPCEAGECFKVKLVPKHRSQYLVDGTGSISTTDYQFVRITGTMSKSPSLWLSRPQIEQRFEKVGEFWMPSYNFSKTHVLFLGEADLKIDYSAYSIEECGHK